MNKDMKDLGFGFIYNSEYKEIPKARYEASGINFSTFCVLTRISEKTGKRISMAFDYESKIRDDATYVNYVTGYMKYLEDHGKNSVRSEKLLNGPRRVDKISFTQGDMTIVSLYTRLGNKAVYCTTTDEGADDAYIILLSLYSL